MWLLEFLGSGVLDLGSPVWFGFGGLRFLRFSVGKYLLGLKVGNPTGAALCVTDVSVR